MIYTENEVTFLIFAGFAVGISCGVIVIGMYSLIVKYTDRKFREKIKDIIEELNEEDI